MIIIISSIYQKKNDGGLIAILDVNRISRRATAETNFSSIVRPKWVYLIS
jgi:hypothetical protein